MTNVEEGHIMNNIKDNQITLCIKWTYSRTLARGFGDNRMPLLAAVRWRGVGNGGGRRHAHSVDRRGRGTVSSGTGYA